MFAGARQAGIVTVEMLLRRPERHRAEGDDVLREHRVDEAADARPKQEVPQVALPPAHFAQTPNADKHVRFVDGRRVKDDPHDAARAGVGRHRDFDARIRAAAGKHELHPVQINAPLAFAKHLEAAVFFKHLHRIGARPARLRVRFSVQKRSVHGIAQVVDHVAVVGVPRIVVQHAGPLGRHEFFGQFERRRRLVPRIAEVGPNRLIVFDDRIVAREGLTLERATRQSRDGDDLCVRIDTHAMIRARKLTFVHFADRKRCAAMRTTIFDRMHRAVLVAPQHQRFA